MADIIHFIPRAELDAEANLQGFIDACRTQLTAFGSQLRFDDNVWDVTDTVKLKGKNHAIRLVFSTWETVNDKVPAPMPEPFLSFAKAYMRYQQALRPVVSLGNRITALRALEAALSERGRGVSVTSVGPEVLNRAAQLTKEKFADRVSYRIGGQLEMIAGFLTDKGLMSVPSVWHHPIRRPCDTARVGKEFDEQRKAKLPSPAALSALAHAFQLVTEPADVLVCSAAAILCSAPDRINEVLSLELDCEVSQKIPSTGADAYGLRWRPSKGAPPMVKWVAATMADVVRQALANIRKVTEDARAVARWYETHPGKIYLPPHLEHLRGRESLSMSELADVLFVKVVNRTVAREWCISNGLAMVKSNGKLSVAFIDVEASVLAFLPRGFPEANSESGLNYSNALFLIQRNAFHADRATYRGVIELIEQGDIYSRLGARSGTGIKSIFDRLGFAEDDGRHICITSHQFRHYLNTLAQAGGMSELDIAKWSGRMDVGQNNAYDHTSDRDVVASYLEVAEEEHTDGSLARPCRAPLIPRDEFTHLNITASHTTEFGYCIHDFSMLPCQIHRDCINCDKQVCIKGEEFREANIRRHREETRELLVAANAANAEGDANANRWVEHQQTTLERLDQLCSILDDPRVPKGAVIQLSGIVPASRLEQAAEGRKALKAAQSHTSERSNRALPAPTDVEVEE
ncbi:MAG: integrase [Thiobacillus sp.]|nr:integrase [Thiobacillus sp.]